MRNIEKMSPIFVVLCKEPTANIYKGVVEHSFGMDVSDTYVNMFWSGKAYSFIGEHMLNGEKDAKYYVDHYKKVHPDWTVEMYNITDENLPIEIDIEKWQAATSKFNSRNANFNMKE